MSRTRRHWFSLICAVCLCRCLSAGILWMEAGILVVNVQDVRKHPVSGVQIGVEGDGGSAVTDDHGKARIRLAPQNKEKDWVSLQIVKSPLGKDLVMVSPWDSRTPIPSFENESENFVRIVVVEYRDRAALENGSVLAALTAKINQGNAPKTPEKEGREEDPKANLAAVAQQFGLDPEDLDKAIRAWGEKTTDTYEAGLAALYPEELPRCFGTVSSISSAARGKASGGSQGSGGCGLFFGGITLRRREIQKLSNRISALS